MFKIQPLAGIQGVVQHTGMSTCELACSRVSPVRTREGRLCTIPVTTCAMAALFIMPANALRMHAIRDHGQLSMAALHGVAATSGAAATSGERITTFWALVWALGSACSGCQSYTIELWHEVTARL